MIKFEGGLSEDCVKYIKKQLAKDGGICCGIVSLIFSIGIVILALQTTLLLLLALIGFIIFVVGMSLPSTYGIDNVIPIEVVIEDDIVSMETNTQYFSRELDKIKRIIDGGSWYLIELYWPYSVATFAMEKDKIVEGTIEEFEEKFGDLIERINN